MLSGRPGVGKTTVAQAVARELSAAGVPVGGFVTEEVRTGPEAAGSRGASPSRRGFAVEDLQSGQRATLADVSLPGPPRIGRYGVDVEAFERVALPALRRPAGGVLVVDEVGPMELESTAFRDRIARLADDPEPAVVTVPARTHPLLERLRAAGDEDAVTTETRDGLPASIVARLRRSLRDEEAA
ncbi:nucleoside-triphosphatase [Egibacter rhizosphaerae]|uniref:nucleoside-triphosphatase n=1 Tax=Egibacter rhizosphaerae TaxID=1670831 RepID=UPI0013F146BF|nr:nucleoside-triphosphatase [Egibacter rhizosphaerae]